MARRWGRVDFVELQTLQENLRQMERMDMEEYFRRVANELAARLLRRVREKTPVGKYKVITYKKKDGSTIKYNQGRSGGELRRNWTIKTLKKNGTVYEIEIVNPTEYASYVEYGHRQQVGRFVPHIGKTLKNGFVEGKFMLKMSEEEIQATAPALLERRLNEMLRGMFDVR